MGHVFYYHSETESAVARVGILSSVLTHRKKPVGHHVSGFVQKFSVATGESESSSSQKFDRRDDEERAIGFYLMRVPLIRGMKATTEAIYLDRLDEYRKQHAARKGHSP